MASEFTASLDSVSEKLDFRAGESNFDAMHARLAVDNQSGAPVHKSDVALVRLEICDAQNDDGSSAEPCSDLSFKVSPVKNVVVHRGQLDDTVQPLSGGGQIRKDNDSVEVGFPNDDKVVVNTKTGEVNVDSQEKYQKDIHFEGTPWQRTIITSDNDTRITVGPENISSVEHNGVMEVFPRSYSIHLGSEPRMPASEELTRKLADKGRDDLSNELDRVDTEEQRAHQAFKPHDSSSVSELSQSIKDRAAFLEKAAQALPAEAQTLNAAAENQLRIALKNMRDQFGAGTPETKDYAEALSDLLKRQGNGDQQQEIDRLSFEAKRGRLMGNVVDNIENSPNEAYPPTPGVEIMAQDRAIAVRKSLISVHISGGDNALKSFVNDVNQRLDSSVLVAPVGGGGPFHHGAIILTEEGATTYNGSFKLIPHDRH